VGAFPALGSRGEIRVFFLPASQTFRASRNFPDHPSPVPPPPRADLDPFPHRDPPTACVCSSSASLPRRRSGRRSSQTLCCAWRRLCIAERGQRYAPHTRFHRWNTDDRFQTRPVDRQSL